MHAWLVALFQNLGMGGGSSAATFIDDGTRIIVSARSRSVTVAMRSHSAVVPARATSVVVPYRPARVRVDES